LLKLKALAANDVTVLGILMEFIFVQANAPEPIYVVPSDNTMSPVRLVQLEYLQLVVYQFVLIKTVEK
jgi:hypothetical protein